MKALITSLALVASCAPVYAAPQCGPQEAVVQMLSQQYGETVQANALTGDPMGPVLVEVWANTTTGTWTITFSEGNGVMCAMASGVDYNEVEPPAAPANL